ncbi:MAG: hypothetical protein HYR85_03245 [Planctomycetes bacterium]|nr:hypothetical protein [Planctomycetota bacterium]MBI3844461.1 hypothetical protein [Planctomycetota bacterium]
MICHGLEWMRTAATIAVGLLAIAPGRALGENASPTRGDADLVHMCMNDSDGVSLDKFVLLASEKTKKPFLLAPTLENTLGERKVKITQSTDVPRKDLFEFFENVLKDNGLALYPVGPRTAELFIVDVLGSTTFCDPPFATSEPQSDREKNIEEGALILDFILAASRNTGHPFLLSPTLENTLGKRRVKLTEAPDIAKPDVLDYYKAILKANDLVLIPIGPAQYGILLVEDLKAVGPAGGLRSAAVFVPVDQLEAWKDRSDMITTMLPLKNIDITRARQELGQLVNTRNGAAITNVAASNSLIVTDFAPTVWSIYQILTAMDQKDARLTPRLEMIALEHTRADELAGTLSRLFRDEPQATPAISDKGAPGGSATEAATAPSVTMRPVPRIVADRQTNSLLVFASGDDLDGIKALVSRIESRAAQNPRDGSGQPERPVQKNN